MQKNRPFAGIAKSEKCKFIKYVLQHLKKKECQLSNILTAY